MSHKNRPPWEIPQRSKYCKRCEKALLAGMEIYSDLTLESGGEYARRDFCAQCWAPDQQSGQQTYWRSLLPVKEVRADPAAMSRERMLLEWLYESLASGEEQADREAFLLALYLARLRSLVRRQEVRAEGVVSTLYEVASTGEALLVPHVKLNVAEMDHLQSMIAERIRGCLDQSAV